MNKRKDFFMVVTGIVIFVAIVVVLAVSLKNNNAENEKTNGVTIEGMETDENGETITSQENTNYWDNIKVIEENGEGETVTDENGETITEEYPGQHSGWSPIVKPEDLE